MLKLIALMVLCSSCYHPMIKACHIACHPAGMSKVLLENGICECAKRVAP